MPSRGWNWFNSESRYSRLSCNLEAMLLKLRALITIASVTGRKFESYAWKFLSTVDLNVVSWIQSTFFELFLYTLKFKKLEWLQFCKIGDNFSKSILSTCAVSMNNNDVITWVKWYLHETAFFDTWHIVSYDKFTLRCVVWQKIRNISNFVVQHNI
jgi:hypothetical protein